MAAKMPAGEPVSSSTPEEKLKRRRVLKDTKDMKSLHFPSQHPVPTRGSTYKGNALSMNRPHSRNDLAPSNRRSPPKFRSMASRTPLDSLNRQPAPLVSPAGQKSNFKNCKVLLKFDGDPDARGTLAIRTKRIILTYQSNSSRHTAEYSLDEVHVTHESLTAEKVIFHISGPRDYRDVIKGVIRRQDLNDVYQAMKLAGNMRRIEESASAGMNWRRFLNATRSKHPHDLVLATRLFAVATRKFSTKSSNAVIVFSELNLRIYQLTGNPVTVPLSNASFEPIQRPQTEGNLYSFKFIDTGGDIEQGEIVIFDDDDTYSVGKELERRGLIQAKSRNEVPPLEPAGNDVVDTATPVRSKAKSRAEAEVISTKTFYGPVSQSSPRSTSLKEIPAFQKSPIPSLPRVAPKLVRRVSRAPVENVESDQERLSDSDGVKALTKDVQETRIVDSAKENRQTENSPAETPKRRRRIYMADLDEEPGDDVIAASSKAVNLANDISREPDQTDYARLEADGFSGFSYDFWDGRSTDVHIEDIARLYPHIYLNDTLISFFLKRALEGLVNSNSALATDVLLLNTFFYTTISRQHQVPSWVSKLKLLTSNIIIMPIHESIHWTVAVIVGLNRLVQDESDNKRPIVCVLDSLGGGNTRASFRRVVTAVSKAVQAQGHGDFVSKSFTQARVTVPAQPNTSDCGVYMVHFIERILSEPDRFIEGLESLPEGTDLDLADFWMEDTLKSKRESMMMELKDLGTRCRSLEVSNEATNGHHVQVPSENGSAPPSTIGSDDSGNFDESNDGFEILEVNTLKKDRRNQSLNGRSQGKKRQRK